MPYYKKKKKKIDSRQIQLIFETAIPTCGLALNYFWCHLVCNGFSELLPIQIQKSYD